jgi:DNA-binding NarL/FixJ family response regulator
LATRGYKVLLLTRQQERARQDRAIMLGARGLLTRDTDAAAAHRHRESPSRPAVAGPRRHQAHLHALSRHGGMPLPDAASARCRRH